MEYLLQVYADNLKYICTELEKYPWCEYEIHFDKIKFNVVIKTDLENDEFDRQINRIRRMLQIRSEGKDFNDINTREDLLISFYRTSVNNRKGRWTKQRAHIVDYLLKHKFMEAKDGLVPGISHATVYNVLEDLVEIGICVRAGELWILTPFY